jgi:hypothetical protein
MADETKIDDVRRDLLTIMQSHAMGATDDQTQQMVAAQLRMLNLIEQMDQKIALLATPKKSPAG